MASIHRRPRSQYYHASFMGPDGRFKLVSTKQTNRSKALEIALQFERTARTGRAGELTEAQCRKVLSDILEKTTGDTVRHCSTRVYLKNWLADKEAAKSAGTAERYGHTVQLFLNHLGERSQRPLSAITARDIQTFVNDRQKSGAAPKTVVVDVKTLNNAFNRARRTGLIQNNPVEAVELPSVESVERCVFSPAQVKMVIDAAPTADWKTLVLVGYFTGARLGDCVAMKWDSVDLARSVISYWPQKARRQKKNSSPVIVPLHPDFEKYLSCLASNDRPETYLCPSLASKGPGGKHGLSESFKRIMGNAGIDSQAVQGFGRRKIHRLTFHSLRHSFNSALANAGVNQEIRMKLTGHTTVSNNSRYTHHELEPLKAAIGKLPSPMAA